MNAAPFCDAYAQKHPYLLVVAEMPEEFGVLGSDPDGIGCPSWSHRSRLVLAQVIANQVGVPLGGVEQPLRALRVLLPERLRSCDAAECAPAAIAMRNAL